MFNFEKNKEPESTDKKYIILELINNSLFNQNIADNTADTLKATRILLFYGIIFSSLSFLTFIVSNSKSEIKKNESVNSIYVDSIYTDYKKNRKFEIQKFDNKIDSLKVKIGQLIIYGTQPKK